MPMSINYRTCPHGIKHDWSIDPKDVCKDCAKEQMERDRRYKEKYQCPFCKQLTYIYQTEYKYCSNNKCEKYFQFIRVIET